MVLCRPSSERLGGFTRGVPAWLSLPLGLYEQLEVSRFGAMEPSWQVASLDARFGVEEHVKELWGLFIVFLTDYREILE